MKYFILFIIYIAVFAALFFILSLFGILWTDYKTVITNKDWFFVYSVLIGWWTAGTIAVDYYEKVIENN